MKASAPGLLRELTAEPSWPAVLSELFKLRLSAMVLLTTLVGFYMGTEGALSIGLLLATWCGTALLACGAAALNQWLEREQDGRMQRTAERPLPSGRLHPSVAAWTGMLASIVGLGVLILNVNGLTALLGAMTLLSYLAVYTPLKRLTWWNTIAGAVPGALPPLMGWTAARGSLDPGGWSLFGILCCWQVTHFYAIAWIYRDDYARGGFVMLPNVDPTGRRTGRQAIGFALALLPVSLSLTWLGVSGWTYAIGASLLGTAFVTLAIYFRSMLTVASARLLFIASIIYLPLLLALMVADRLWTG